MYFLNINLNVELQRNTIHDVVSLFLLRLLYVSSSLLRGSTLSYTTKRVVFEVYWVLFLEGYSKNPVKTLVPGFVFTCLYIINFFCFLFFFRRKESLIVNLHCFTSFFFFWGVFCDVFFRFITPKEIITQQS